MDTLKPNYFVTFLLVTAMAVSGYITYKKAHTKPGINNNITNISTESATTTYRNVKYGFEIILPKSWKEFTVSEEEWEGNAPEVEQTIQSGPFIFIHHPLWTEENERQDIPVMVFTLDQWNRLNNEEFHIGAAPVNPTQLARNKKYVFALPARYNYSFLPGFEEVDVIIKSGAIRAF